MFFTVPWRNMEFAVNITRITMLFQLTTNPADRSNANQHIGGWSESVWTNLTPTQAIQQLIPNLLRTRAALLPLQASIVGYRVSQVNVQGNRLLAGASQSTNITYPGVVTNSTDVPQMALQLRGVSGGVPNRNNFWLRGIPDDMVTNGEYQPTRAFATAVTAYRNLLANTGSYGFLARDLTQPTSRVISIDVTGKLTCDGTIVGVAAGDFIRFRRTFDQNRKPVTGSYFVIAVPTPNTYTLQGITQIVVKPSGTVRKDVLNFLLFNGVSFNRIGVKKVGRPFEGYRGRRSRKSA